MAYLDQHPQSTPRQLFPLNPRCTPRGPAKSTGVSSSPKLHTPLLLRKKDAESSMLSPKATTPTRKVALDSLGVYNETSANLTLQHERQLCLKELSSVLANQRTTSMSWEPEPGFKISRYEMDVTTQPCQREDEESGGLHLASDSSSLIFSCSQASDSRDNNATFSWSEETSPTKGRSLMIDSLSPGRLDSDNSSIPTSDDCRGIQGDTEEVLKQHGGRKRVGRTTKHHHGIHFQNESLGPVSGAKTYGHLFFPKAAVRSNAASLNSHSRVRPSHLQCKSTRYSSGDHQHLDIAHRLSISRPLNAALEHHSDNMLLSNRHLKHDYTDKEADENCKSGRSPVHLRVLPVSSRLPAHKEFMLVKGCTLRTLLSNMEPYRLARPHMDVTKPVSSRKPTERRDLGINPDEGNDHDHGNANSSEEKEQENKYDDDDDDDEDDDDSNEEDYDDFDEMFNTQTHLAELTHRHQKLSLSPAGLLNYVGNVGDSQERQPVKRKVNLSRGPLTKTPSERRIATSSPGVHTEECEQSDLTATAEHEDKPLSEKMMKEYFRQLKLTICGNLAEEKFIDELVMRNVKACSLYDQFSNVKLKMNHQDSDGQSSAMSPRRHYCSAADGEAESLKTLCLVDTEGSCGAFQAADEPKATKPDTW